MAESPPPGHFDTPERTERLQLVAHLARNADTTPYVRGPVGAGKTAFASRLSAALRTTAPAVLLDAARCDDVPGAISDALHLPQGSWPGAVLDAPGAAGAVVVVDNADALEARAAADLQALRSAGGRVVLLGRDPATLGPDWSLQLVDLPPFTEAQAREFLAARGCAEAALWDEDRLQQLHDQAGGQPGPLLDAAAGGVLDPGRGAPWKWVLGGAAAGLVALVLWQQERINALFSPAPVAEPQLAAEPVPPAAPANTIPIPPKPPVAAAPDPVAPSVEPVPAPEQSAERAPIPAPEALPPPAPAIQDESSPPEPGQQSPADAASAQPSDPAPIERAPAAAPEAAEAPPPVAPPPAAEAPPPPAEPPRAEPPAAIAQTAAQTDLAWLRSRDPGHYTLQLLGARDRAAIEQFIARHRLPGKYAVFTRDLEGKPWYSLVYGDYPDRDAAVRGRAALPASLRRTSVWPRTFASVWEQLPGSVGSR